MAPRWVMLADHFHGSETEVARALIAATPRIAQRVPQVQVVIAGGGGLSHEVSWRGKPSRSIIDSAIAPMLLPGHRNDMQQLLGLATVAVR